MPAVARVSAVLVAAVFACAKPVTKVTPAAAVAPELRAAEALLALAPAASRCVVVFPTRADAEQRAQIALASQSDGLPYRTSGLIAYVRAEQRSGELRHAQLELLRFAQPPAHAEAQRWFPALDRDPTCVSCNDAHVEWLDARTLRVQRGSWEHEGPQVSCLDALHARPDAIEVAVRVPSIRGGELRETQITLRARGQGIERISTRSFREPEAAERTYRAALRGQEELPTLVGVAADGLGELEGERWRQRTFVSFADLQLALDDRVRAVPDVAPVDPSDRQAVYAAFDNAQGSREDLALLLSAALERAPHDDGLLQRQFQLLLARDAPAAYALALRGNSRVWRLRARTALANFDEAGLQRALREEHALSASLATKMARELYAKHPRDEAAQDHDEATFLSALRMTAVARTPLTLRLPLLELPRLLATLAQAAQPERPLAMQLLAFHAQGSTDALGRPATLLFANDDAQLIAMGRSLVGLMEGPFELRIAFEDGVRRTTLALVGQREGGWLAIDHGSRALKALHWDTLERLLATPLRKLTGNAFPPDELVIEARDEAEASDVEHSAASCSRDGLTVRCRGALADINAGRRALIAVLHELAAGDARALWSGTD